MFLNTPERAVLFIHNPRTAGTSICAAFPQVEVKWLSSCAQRNPSGYTRHVPWSMVVERLNYPSFSFVRNPWARQFSLYWRLKTGRNWCDLSKISFKRWLMEPSSNWLRLGDETYQRLRRRPWLLDIQHRPQMWWVAGCDYICRYERLEQELAKVCEKLDIPKPAVLPRLNANPKDTPYQEAYDTEMIEAVETWFREDIQAWGYGFDS